MRTIHKFPIQIADQQKVEVPESATPLYVGFDPAGALCIWCQVEDLLAHGTIEDQARRNLFVYVVGTGNPIPPPATTYLGSFKQVPFMWHVYTNH